MTHGNDHASPESLEQLGVWLRDLRERAKLTQQNIAQATSSESRSVIRWEAGENELGGLALLLYLSAVGAEVVPAPPGSTPRAVNAELVALRREVRQLAGRLEGVGDLARAAEKVAAALEQQATLLARLALPESVPEQPPADQSD